MQHHIRPAEASDIPHLLSLIHQKAEFDGCPNAVTATAEKLSRTMFSPQPMAHVLLAEVKPALSPIGFASYHFTYSTFRAQPSLWLDDLFIQSAYRNQAIGTRLMCQLCAIAYDHGCGRIDWTVNIQNHAGIRFYQRIGGKLQTQVHLCRLTAEAIRQNVS
ncbi:MAG: GNAT family N-acetyltransferase [Phormidesmis sp. RL_2_1]|nr:GNAT family N-acetyltransferase [Phormidesmis sp. RL_2_1]